MRQLGGVGVALTTPLNDDYSIDFPSLEELVDHVIEGGVDYLVVQGTTGETPVFTWKEKLQILDFVLAKNNGRKAIVFGLGGNNTFDLVEKSRDLKDFGIDAILSVSPYYNKPSQKGIIRHYDMIANASPHPVILYNVPARTSSNMRAETTLNLAGHPNIIGMKEASGDMEQCRQIANQRPEDFTLLSGDDTHTLNLIKSGADGVISVVANLVPDKFCKMIRAALDRDMKNAEKLNDELNIIYQLSVKEGNPSSIKAGLEAIGIGSRRVKPPLYDASDKLIEEWKQYL